MHKMMVFVSLACALSLTSCLEKGDETVVLPRVEENVWYDVIPDTLQHQLEDWDFDIFRGSTPPIVEGTYVISPMELIYASDNYHPAAGSHDLYISFSDQGPRGILLYSENQVDSVVGTAITSRVIGHDDCFTVYCIQYVGVPGSTWKCKTATILSGRISSAGIKECKYAFVILDKESQNPSSEPSIAPEGTYRIFMDADGLAQRIEN